MRIVMTVVSLVLGGGGVAMVALFITTIEDLWVPRHMLFAGALLVLISWLIYQGSGKIPGE